MKVAKSHKNMKPWRKVRIKLGIADVDKGNKRAKWREVGHEGLLP
ncbi:hypothetical protein [Pyrococcus woesei]|nr:hypothetical protein [Pyrococcus sp.]